MKKIIVVLVIITFLPAMNALAISKNEPLKNLGTGLDNMAYGVIETPDSANQTQSKGEPACSECTSDTKDDVGRGIARVVGGIWQVATFWYPTD